MNHSTAVNPIRFTSTRRISQITAFAALLVVVGLSGAVYTAYVTEESLAVARRDLKIERENVAAMRADKVRLTKELEELKSQLKKIRELNQELDEAIRLQANERNRESIKKLTEVLKVYPQSEVALYWLSRAYFKAKDYSAALSTAERSIEIDPAYIDPHAIVVYALHGMGKDKEAAGRLQSALDLNIDAYGHFLGRTRELEELWKVKVFRDVFLKHQARIAEIQNLLIRRGFLRPDRNGKGGADAIVGSHTRESVDRFCHESGIAGQPKVSVLLSLLKSSKAK